MFGEAKFRIISPLTPDFVSFLTICAFLFLGTLNPVLDNSRIVKQQQQRPAVVQQLSAGTVVQQLNAGAVVQQLSAGAVNQAANAVPYTVMQQLVSPLLRQVSQTTRRASHALSVFF